MQTEEPQPVCMDSAQAFEDLKLETESVLQGLGRFLSELVDGGGEGCNGAIDAQVGESYRQYSLLRTRFREQNLTVAVLALAKSGASLILAGCNLQQLSATSAYYAWACVVGLHHQISQSWRSPAH